MKSMDFEFDGKRLSSFGMILCNFGDKGIETINGVKINFNTISVHGGSKNYLVSTQYEDCLESTVQICRNPCGGNSMEISTALFRELTKWLCRKSFLKLKFLSEEYIDIYYESIINVNKIEIDGSLIGLELNILCNRPFALKEPRIININNTSINGEYSINDTSDEEGYIYPFTEIVIGNIDNVPETERNLKIYNAIEDRDTYIANVSTNEVITMDYPIITSSFVSHKIQNNFNWNFFRIANTYKNSRNDLIISLPCTIKIKYSPIAKVGF